MIETSEHAGVYFTICGPRCFADNAILGVSDEILSGIGYKLSRVLSLPLCVLIIFPISPHRFHLLHLSSVRPRAMENAIMKLDDTTQRGEICSWLISILGSNCRAFLLRFSILLGNAICKFHQLDQYSKLFSLSLSSLSASFFLFRINSFSILFELNLSSISGKYCAISCL